MPILIGQQVTNVLQAEGELYKLNVAYNILKSKQHKSGYTVRSIRPIATNDTLVIYGRENFQNIETGVSPIEAQKLDFAQFRKDIYAWSKYLPINFNEKERGRFAFNVTKSIMQKGSLLWQKGGRKDIYTNEAQKIINNISDKVGKIILDTQIL